MNLGSLHVADMLVAQALDRVLAESAAAGWNVSSGTAAVHIRLLQYGNSHRQTD
jgi:hypothetical protein